MGAAIDTAELSAETIAAFVARWQKSGAAERANYQLFLSELCDVLGVPRPQPAGPDDALNEYVFERAVTFRHGDGSDSPGRIDLYKRGCFVLEAKQGADQTQPAERPLAARAPARPRKGAAVRGTKGWDDAMVRARGQAEAYAKALPVAEGWPPFLVVVDVGHCIELYADFSRSGKHYTQFPDAGSFRIPLGNLGRDDVRTRLRLVWIDPLALDPARRAARVTREIAERLARLAKSLEAAGHAPKTVATFLMRCLFTMFAEDVGLLRRRRTVFRLMPGAGRVEPIAGLPPTLPRLTPWVPPSPALPRGGGPGWGPRRARFSRFP
ncbi:MAG: type IIL restriction-modification enzyme MmeI [Dongiaceae bacterium]